MSENSVLDESPACHCFKVRPGEIQLSAINSVMGRFGKFEVEQSAGKLIRFFQSRGLWCSFTLDELQRYYEEKGWGMNSMFFGLTGAWYDDTMEGPGWRRSWPCIAIDSLGLHYVTEHFVLRCAGKLESRQDEKSFKITRISLKTPDADDTELGDSPKSLKQAAVLFSFNAERTAAMFTGEIVIHLLDEKNGEVHTATFSVTQNEFFLTVPK